MRVGSGKKSQSEADGVALPKKCCCKPCCSHQSYSWTCHFCGLSNFKLILEDTVTPYPSPSPSINLTDPHECHLSWNLMGWSEWTKASFSKSKHQMYSPYRAASCSFYHISVRMCLFD